ncbi:MAG: hypothetical protein QG594_634 [Bacteroidota bacterium]|nr:hypothetical protein [Bacteroidota bacterium]
MWLLKRKRLNAYPHLTQINPSTPHTIQFKKMKKLTKKERNVIYKYLLKTVNSKVWGDCFLCWKFYKHLGLQEKDWWGESDTIKREQRVFNEFPEFSKAYKEFILGNRWLHEASQRKIVLNRCIELSK